MPSPHSILSPYLYQKPYFLHIYMITIIHWNLKIVSLDSFYHQLLRGLVPHTSPSALFFSNSSFVLSSNALISSMVIPCHLSVQQNTCRWKFENNRFSVCIINDSTLVCSPNHLNSHVTSLQHVMTGSTELNHFFPPSFFKGPRPVLSDVYFVGSS